MLSLNDRLHTTHQHQYLKLDSDLIEIISTGLSTKSFRDLNNNLSISCGLVVRYHGVADLWEQENVKGVHVARKNKSINHSSRLNQTQTVRYLYTGRCILL